MALIFLGFTFYNSHQQKKYQEQLMAYNAEQARIQAEQDSLLALNAPLPTACLLYTSAAVRYAMTDGLHFVERPDYAVHGVGQGLKHQADARRVIGNRCV